MSAVTTVWVSFPTMPGTVELELKAADRPQDWDECETCGESGPGLTDPLTAIHACHPCFLKQLAMGQVRVVAAK